MQTTRTKGVYAITPIWFASSSSSCRQVLSHKERLCASQTSRSAALVFGFGRRDKMATLEPTTVVVAPAATPPTGVMSTSGAPSGGETDASAQKPPAAAASKRQRNNKEEANGSGPPPVVTNAQRRALKGEDAWKRMNYLYQSAAHRTPRPRQTHQQARVESDARGSLSCRLCSFFFRLVLFSSGRVTWCPCTARRPVRI